MIDLFDLPPEDTPPTVKPGLQVAHDRAAARIIAEAVFPASFSSSEKVREEASMGTPVERHQHFQIERCQIAVDALRMSEFIA